MSCSRIPTISKDRVAAYAVPFDPLPIVTTQATEARAAAEKSVELLEARNASLQVRPVPWPERRMRLFSISSLFCVCVCVCVCKSVLYCYCICSDRRGVCQCTVFSFDILLSLSIAVPVHLLHEDVPVAAVVYSGSRPCSLRAAQMQDMGTAAVWGMVSLRSPLA